MAKNKQENKKDDWILAGWLNMSKSGKALNVSVMDGEKSKLIGTVSIDAVDQLIQGEKTGVPFKMPPEKNEGI